MPTAVRLRKDYSAEELRASARRSKNVNQSRRLLSLAAVRKGMDRGSAAKIGGMDRQTLRDWVHPFNAFGPDGLLDNWTDCPKPRLSAVQLAEFAKIVEAGPDRAKDDVVRWRRVDLKRIIAEMFRVEFHERYVGTLLKKLGFSHVSARPRHPAQDERIVEAFKKRMARPVCKGFFESADDQSAATYPASEDSLPAKMEIRALRSSSASRRRAPFFKPGFRSAVRLSGHLDITSRKPHRSVSALRLCPDQRLRRQGQSPDDEPFAAP
jgi:transposase